MRRRWLYLLISLILLLAIAMMIVFAVRETPDRTMSTVIVSVISAFIGVALTMGVTQMQLDNQSERDRKADKAESLRDRLVELSGQLAAERENRDRDFAQREKRVRAEVEAEMQRRLDKESIIFQQRLKIYQDYLKTLLDVVEDGSVSREERLKLQFQTSFIAMHTSAHHIREISECVKDIVHTTCAENRTMILEPLFKLVHEFREELYTIDDDADYKDMLPNTIKNFELAYDEDDSETDALADASSDEPTNDGSLWKEAVARWSKDGWRLESGRGGEWFVLQRSDGRPGSVSGGFRLGKAFLRTEINKDDADFAKYLKWNLPPGVDQSRRSQGMWETTGNDYMRKVTEGNLVEVLQTDNKLAEFVSGVVDYLILRQNESVLLSMVRQDLLKTYKAPDRTGWSWPEIYDFRTLFSNYDTRTDEGIRFLDLYENYDAGELQIILGNRNKAPESIERTRREIGLTDIARYPANELGRIVLERMPLDSKASDVAKVMFGWMEKLGVDNESETL